MARSLRVIWIAAILSVLQQAVAADENGQWRAEKQMDGIAVFSKPVEHSPLRAVRAETEIHASFASTLELLLDAAKRPQWDEICADASVYEQVSESEDLVYIHNKLPWPVSDRDMVLRRSWSVTTDGSSAQIRTVAANDVMPEVRGRIRVKQADGLWTIDRTGDSSVRVSAEIHADPGGPIPDMLVNSLSIDGPFKALRNIRQLLESSRFQPGH